METSKLGKFTTFFLIIAFAGQALAGELPLLARDALIGKWSADVTADDGRGKSFADTLTFKGGNFTSTAQEKDGFKPAAYEDSPAPLGISAKFTVTLSNAAGDKATWSGFSTGAEIEGTLVVTRKNGSPVSYSFKATK